MTYVAKTWADHPSGGTVIDASSLNRLENAMSAVHDVADMAATAEDLIAVNTQAVETADALAALTARVAELEAYRSANVAFDGFYWQKTVQSQTSMGTPTHDSGDGVAATISGEGIIISPECKAAFIHAAFHNTYSAGTSSRRRWQIQCGGADTWTHASGIVVGAIDVQTGDRHSMTVSCVPGGLYTPYGYMGNSGTVTTKFRVVAFF